MGSNTFSAYKAFDHDFTCRGFQFEVGKTYEHSGDVMACESGFHACENPFDVLKYYPLVDDSGRLGRFACVTVSGVISRDGDDSKIAAGSIAIDAELRLPGFIEAGVKWLVAATKGATTKNGSSGNYAQIGSSGNDAQIGSSGNYARIGSSGYDAQIGSSGNYARIGSSGNYARIGSSGDGARIGSSGLGAQIGSSGNDAQIGSSGYGAQIGSSGNDAQIGSSGYGAQINCEGAHSTVACAGLDVVVTVAEGGAFCIPYHDGARVRFLTGYAGEDGIKPGTPYRVENGKLVEAL